MAKKKRNKIKYDYGEIGATLAPTPKVTCSLCGDNIVTGNMKGTFNCPSCGNEIKIK